MERTNLFDGLAARELPTLHEIRALSSHLYAKAGFEVAAVQDLMAHTDPGFRHTQSLEEIQRLTRLKRKENWG